MKWWNNEPGRTCCFTDDRQERSTWNDWHSSSGGTWTPQTLQAADILSDWHKSVAVTRVARHRHTAGVHQYDANMSLKLNLNSKWSKFKRRVFCKQYASSFRALWILIGLDVSVLEYRKGNNSCGAQIASYSMGKAAGAWSLPFTSIECRGYEWVKLNFCSPYTPSWREEI